MIIHKWRTFKKRETHKSQRINRNNYNIAKGGFNVKLQANRLTDLSDYYGNMVQLVLNISVCLKISSCFCLQENLHAISETEHNADEVCTFYYVFLQT